MIAEGSKAHHGVLTIIPARLKSTRFPNKVLHPILGKPMLQYAWEAAENCSEISRTIIATDSEEVKKVAEGFGAEVVMTPESLPSGTDRVAFVARDFNYPFVLNLQADEPMVTSAVLTQLAKQIQSDDAPIATLAHKCSNFELLKNPNRVKVVLNNSSKALFFSREPIKQMDHFFYLHVGIYAFQKNALDTFCRWPQSQLEKTERLEQLRALENGMAISVGITDFVSHGVDEFKDVEEIERQLRNEKN